MQSGPAWTNAVLFANIPTCQSCHRSPGYNSSQASMMNDELGLRIYVCVYTPPSLANFTCALNHAKWVM